MSAVPGAGKGGLNDYARPVIGAKPVDTIGTDDVSAILKPTRISKTETVERVQGRIGSIPDYAAAHGYRGRTNPACRCRHLGKLLPPGPPRVVF